MIAILVGSFTVILSLKALLWAKMQGSWVGVILAAGFLGSGLIAISAGFSSLINKNS